MLSPEALAALAAQQAALPGTELRAVSPDTEIHVDGDYLAYYFAGNDDTSFGSCRRNTMDCLENVARIAGAGGRKVLHLTSPVSTKGGRFLIATDKPYQGQRDSGRKPKNWQAMRDWLEGKDLPYDWRVVIWADREADDGVACAARYALECGRTPAIFTRDKDFRMIPGLHIDWDTLGIIHVPRDAFAVIGFEPDVVYGAKWFWLQMLQGDTADNIPGCPKVLNAKGDKLVNCGPKTAETLLAGCKTPSDCFTVVRACYTECYGPVAWAKHFVEQAALLWMRHDRDADIGSFTAAIPVKCSEIKSELHKLTRRVEHAKAKGI